MTGTPETKPRREELALLFSGGLDTTLEAVERLREYRHIHLLTFDNGFCINVGGSRRRAADLGRLLGPERVTHVILDTGILMQDLRRRHQELIRSYRSPLSFDLVCKLSALTELIFYARSRGITDISDGASKGQTQVFLQHPDFTRSIKPFPDSYGLKFLEPVHFHVGREEKIALLRKIGLPAGVPGLERLHITSQLAHQPFCLRGFVTYFFTSPTRSLDIVRRHTLSHEKAKELWDRLLPDARAYLDGKLAAAGAPPTKPAPVGPGSGPTP